MTNAVIIGSGNIAYHFYPALNKLEGLNIGYLFTRSEVYAKEIVAYSSLKIINQYADIPLNTEVVFLMVNDDSIKSVSKNLKVHIKSSTLLIHFSGSLGLSAIDKYFPHKGIIWPIQSVSNADQNLDLADTPMSISYSDNGTKEQLVTWVSQISNHIYFLSAEEKKVVHLSAIFANNFTNHLYALAREILEKENLEFELIRPLIQKTAQKAVISIPANNQTGPAIRNDVKIMNSQLDMITDPEIREIYKLISKSILKKSLK